MQKAIFIFLLVSLAHSSQAFAAPGWFWRACDRIIMRGPPKIPPSLMKVQTAMGDALFRVNKTLAHKLSESTVPLEFLSERPLGLEILAQPNSEYTYVRQVDMRIFATPASVDADWSDSGEDLSAGTALVLLYKNVKANVDGVAIDADTIVRQEFEHMQQRNPRLQMSLQLGLASDVAGLEFRSEYRDFHAAWVQGTLRNSQLKHATLVLMADAISRIYSDPQYATKAGQLGPTKH